MKCAARIALGVAGGYFLGRTRKMKLALLLGGMAAGRGGTSPARLLAQGRGLLAQSPELAKLADDVRGRLLEAGKGAALAVATRQVESLTDRLSTGVDSVTKHVPAADVPQQRDEPPPEDNDRSEPEEESGSSGRRGSDRTTRRRTGARSASGEATRAASGSGRTGSATRRASGTSTSGRVTSSTRRAARGSRGGDSD